MSQLPPVKTPKSKAKLGPSVSDKEIERIDREIAKIDALELSDVDSPDWATAKQEYARQSGKRLIDVQQIENNKRKVSDWTFQKSDSPHTHINNSVVER